MNEAWQLFALHVSPWSERARWALDHHGLRYREIEHVPMLGEYRLRQLAKKASAAKATVPLLVTGDAVVSDSWNIARHADNVGKNATLFPDARAVEEWNDLGDRMMLKVRVLSVLALLQNPEAQDESMPTFIPKALRTMNRPLVRMGARYIAKKYGFRGDEDPRPYEDEVIPHLERLRATLATRTADAPYLLGTFSYADIIMAAALQGVRPVDDKYLRLGAAIREVWTRTRLAESYKDLLAWRDRIYAMHRRRGQ